jgi:hypothetical protein
LLLLLFAIWFGDEEDDGVDGDVDEEEE